MVQKQRGGRPQSYAETQLWRATTPEQKKYWSDIIEQHKVSGTKGGSIKTAAKKVGKAAAVTASVTAPIILSHLINKSLKTNARNKYNASFATNSGLTKEAMDMRWLLEGRGRPKKMTGSGDWKNTAKKVAIGAAAFSAAQLAPLALHVMINGTQPTAQLYPSKRQRGWGLFGDIAGNVTQAKNGWDSLSDYQKNGTIAALKDFPLDKFLKNADRAFSS